MTGAWKIGDATIFRIEEQIGPSSEPRELLPDWDPEVLDEHGNWLAPNYYDLASNRLVTSIHSWLIRTKRHTIVVDCCCGNHKDRPGNPRFHALDTPYLERLRAAGVEPQDVDFVVCTHLHSDHVGWNTRLVDGRWVPTFPNAKYVFSKTERNYWDPDHNPSVLDGIRERNPLLATRLRLAFEDSVAPVIAAGQVHLVDTTDALGDELFIEPAPGHTPGHIVLRMSSDGKEAIFCGDAIHHPIQVYRTRWSTGLCSDPVQAAYTRERILQYCAEHDCLLLPGHFGVPHLGRVKTQGDTFSFEFEQA